MSLPKYQRYLVLLSRGSAVVLFLVASFLLHADTGKYLEANTVYCHDKHALASYLAFVRARDMPGLNMMVVSGECDFTPDDTNVLVPTYRTENIDTTVIVAFSFKGKTAWTFEKLLKSL
ncbi:MAG: hypothetical protein ACC707_08815 [Thiohalomonadales bacterium]